MSGAPQVRDDVEVRELQPARAEHRLTADARRNLTRHGRRNLKISLRGLSEEREELSVD
jgi:hypothetical protein